MKKFLFLIVFLLCVTLVSCITHGDKNEKAQTTEAEIFPETGQETEVITETEAVTNPPETTGKEEETLPAAVTEESTAEETEETAPDPGSPEDILMKMTTEEKIGQLFLCRAPADAEDGKKLIEKYHVGGIIFFGANFKNSDPAKFGKITYEYQSVSKLGLLTAVDEEGGTVCRASLYPSFRSEKFRSPSEIYAGGGLDAIKKDSREKSEFLLSLGLNFNLAPVVDVSTDESDFIYARSLGLDAEKTAEYASAVTVTMREEGILSALKHFPGYGNNADTHTGIAYDNRSIESLMSCDILPFKAGIEAGAPIILISHNIVNAIDSSLPASLSPKINELLRSELGFDGVTVTDDLSMKAIMNFTSGEDAAVLAVIAGNDLLCTSDVENQYPAILAAVESGRITEERLNEAVLRILKMKNDYGIIDKKAQEGYD